MLSLSRSMETFSNNRSPLGKRDPVSRVHVPAPLQEGMTMKWIWPHDHKLRKYLSLKLDFVYLKFYWTHCLIICRYEQTVLFNIFLTFWFINKTTAKVILVWHFDLRIFSVYGHGAKSILTNLSWFLVFFDDPNF